MEGETLDGKAGAKKAAGGSQEERCACHECGQGAAVALGHMGKDGRVVVDRYLCVNCAGGWPFPRLAGRRRRKTAREVAPGKARRGGAG